MLMGESGTRKSTAINIAKRMLQDAGYNHFSAEQTSKEKYLEDLSDQHEAFAGDAGDITSATLFGASQDDSRTTPNFIVAGEFNDFIGNGNIEFMSWLGNLWDWPTGAPYTKKFKNSKSVSIPNPTISLLGGNTATGFSLAFPPHAIGQGFFSRLILVHGDPSGRKIHKPKFPDNTIVEQLKYIRGRMVGGFKEDSGVDSLLERIYIAGPESEDSRFKAYSNRRHAQLVKLVMICAAVRGSICISEDDVIHANTILTHAEALMPKALGEFGKARNSDIAHVILDTIQGHGELITHHELYAKISQDIDGVGQFQDILQKLMTAGKIQGTVAMKGGEKKVGFLPIRKAIDEGGEFVDFNFLTKEERNMKT